MSGANISSLSIQDSSLSANIPLKNANLNTFTGTISVATATIGSAGMVSTNTITGNTNIGSSNTNDTVNYIGKHNFSNSSTNAYTFNGLTCNGYSYFNTHPPECPIAPETDDSLVNKTYCDTQLSANKSKPYSFSWTWAVSQAGASIVKYSLVNSNTRTVYMIMPNTISTSGLVPFTVKFNYFMCTASQNSTVPTSTATEYQTTFYYIYSNINNLLYKTKEVGSTGTGGSYNYTVGSTNYAYTPLTVTADAGNTVKAVKFVIGLPNFHNDPALGPYICSFASSLRIENSWQNNQTSTSTTTGIAVYPSADSINEQGVAYFSKTVV